MERPVRFEHTRFLGDKRTQLVYDLDEWTEEAIIDEIVNEGVGLCFGPDTLAEARNRAYAMIDHLDWPEGFCRSDIGWRAL